MILGMDVRFRLTAKRLHVAQRYPNKAHLEATAQRIQSISSKSQPPMNPTNYKARSRKSAEIKDAEIRREANLKASLKSCSDRSKRSDMSFTHNLLCPPTPTMRMI